MTKDIYILDISRSTAVQDIFSMVLDAGADRDLTPAEQTEVKLYGDRRMSQLNAEAVGPQTPRW
jgi:hypothetical protein